VSVSVDSAPSLGVYYFFLSLTLSLCLHVCMYVCHAPSNSSSLFLDGIEPFLAVSSPCGTLQNVVFDF